MNDDPIAVALIPKKRIRTLEQRARAQELYCKNREKALERMKKWHIENRIQKSEYNRKYRLTDKGRAAVLRKKYNDNRPEIKTRRNAHQRAYYLENVEKIRMKDRMRSKLKIVDKVKSKVSQRKYYYSHQEKILADRKRDKEKIAAYSRKYNLRPARRAYRLERYKSDIEYRLRLLLRTRLAKTVQGKAYKKAESAMKLIGCSASELKMYLEGQFKDGMTWENHGLHGWHIDHKVPLAFFNLENTEQQKQAFHYSNLQPLWALENLRKHAKITV